MVLLVMSVIVLLAILGMLMLLKGVKDAENVDPKSPFLYGDYDEENDPTLKMK